MRAAGLWVAFGLGGVAVAGEGSVEELLAAVDRNLVADRSATVTVTVASTGDPPRPVRELQVRTHARGADGAAEVLAPARDKGTRMRHQGAQWAVWVPSAGRVQQLTEEAARQAVFDSDLNHVDLLGPAGLSEGYRAAVLRQDALDGRPCQVIELVATGAARAYPRRVVWIDPQAQVPLKQELYAANGMLLKTWTAAEISAVGGHQVPVRVVVEDQVKKGSRTTLVLTDLVYATPDPAVFEAAWLGPPAPAR